MRKETILNKLKQVKKELSFENTRPDKQKGVKYHDTRLYSLRKDSRRLMDLLKEMN